MKNTIDIITLSAEPQDDGHPFEAIILSGEPISGTRRADGTKRERFIVDFATLEHPPRVVVNYNHNDEIIIGYGENFHMTPEGLKSTGKLVAGNEFRDHLINLAKNGVPFEASVEIDLDSATETIIGDNEHVTVNGRNYVGPLAIYSGVSLSAYAMCPHGADKFTNFTLLKEEKNYVMKKKNTIPTTNLSNDNNPAPDPKEEVKAAVRDQDLADFCEMFGDTNGLALYQSGADIAEARQWQSLNEKYSQYLAADDADDNTDTDPPPAVDDEQEEKLSAALTKLSNTVASLQQANAEQAAVIAKLQSAIPRGEQMPVTHNFKSEEPVQLSAKEEYLQAVTQRLQK